MFSTPIFSQHNKWKHFSQMWPTIIKVPEVSSYKVIKEKLYKAKNITAQKCLNMFEVWHDPFRKHKNSAIKIEIFSGSIIYCLKSSITKGKICLATSLAEFKYRARLGLLRLKAGPQDVLVILEHNSRVFDWTNNAHMQWRSKSETFHVYFRRINRQRK